MELALNLGWGLLTLLLCGACLTAARYGRLRLSLAAALGCTMLLAVLLFPAISMTDDLQRADYEFEQRARHFIYVASVPLTTSVQSMLVVLAPLLVALCCDTRLRLQRRLQHVVAEAKTWLKATPLKVRPPTAAAAV